MTTIAPDILIEIVRRVVAIAEPDKIIMFGSAARGTMGPHSDVDLLVIKSGVYDHGKLSDHVHMGLNGVRQPTGIIIATPETIERYKDSFALVYYPALREGRVVYEAARRPAALKETG